MIETTNVDDIANTACEAAKPALIQQVKKFLHEDYPLLFTPYSVEFHIQKKQKNKHKYTLKKKTVNVLYDISYKRKIKPKKDNFNYSNRYVSNMELYALLNQKRKSKIKAKLDKQLINQIVNKNKRGNSIMFNDYQYVDVSNHTNYILLLEKYIYFKENPIIVSLNNIDINLLCNNLSLFELEQLIQIIDFVICGQQLFYEKNLKKTYETQKLINVLKNVNYQLCSYMFNQLSNISIKKDEYTLLHGGINQNLIKILLNNTSPNSVLTKLDYTYSCNASAENHKNDQDDINYIQRKNLEHQTLKSDVFFNFLYKNDILLSNENRYLLQNNVILGQDKNQIWAYLSFIIENTFNAYMSMIINIDDKLFKEKTIYMTSLLGKKLQLFCSNFELDNQSIQEFIKNKIKYIKENNILNKSNSNYIEAFYYDIERQSSRKIFFLSQLQRQSNILVNAYSISDL